MPAILCKCEKRLSFGQIPCPIEWLTISDVEYDSYHGEIDAEELYRNMKHILKCPNCKRLNIYWNGFSNKPEIFKLENDQ